MPTEKPSQTKKQLMENYEYRPNAKLKPTRNNSNKTKASKKASRTNKPIIGKPQNEKNKTNQHEKQNFTELTNTKNVIKQTVDT